MLSYTICEENVKSQKEYKYFNSFNYSVSVVKSLVDLQGYLWFKKHKLICNETPIGIQGTTNGKGEFRSLKIPRYVCNRLVVDNFSPFTISEDYMIILYMYKSNIIINYTISYIVYYITICILYYNLNFYGYIMG